MNYSGSWDLSWVEEPVQNMPTRSNDEDASPHDNRSNFEEIPPFANFDDFEDNNDDRSKELSLQESSSTSGRHRSSKKEVSFDSVAAADYKWAKEQASRIAKYEASIDNRKDKLIPRPKSGGLLRSGSLGNGNSQTHFHARNSFTSASSRSSENHIPRTRSMSPSPHSTRDSKENNRLKPRIVASKRSLSAPHDRPSEEDLKLEKYYAGKNFMFQTTNKLVTCRTIDISNRVAYERKNIVTPQDIYQMVTDDTNTGETVESRMNKISPSIQHAELLNAISKIKSIRQLCWSPLLNENADPFYGWEEDDDESDRVSLKDTSDRAKRKKRLLEEKRKRIAAKRGGKYKALDPKEYISSVLPDHEPQLTNIKRRLPRRSDVGFPNATKEEIELKQSEIAKEAKLEEVSPRLLILLSSDDVGTDPSISANKSQLPFASPALLDAKAVTKESVVRKTIRQHQNRKPQPDRFSFFAPPLDATPSSQLIWRARPFFDQPPGLRNTIVIPLDVKFEVGNIEPLVCSLSLYYLPPKGASEDESCRGKISEDFIFPSGDWKNLLREKGGEAIAEQMQIPFDEKSMNNRSKKAIFSYDPDDIATNSGSFDGEKHLFLLLQVHKVVHRGALNAYVDSTNASARKGFFSAGNKSQTLRGIARERSENAFKTFGAQFLTPFCFGIIPLLPQIPERNREQIRWPNGVNQSMNLFCHNDSLESENSFLDKLSMIAHQCQNNLDTITLENNEESEVQDNMGKSFGSSTISKFRRNKKHASGLMRTSSNPDLYHGLKIIAGKASFRNSLLGVDFSESLLRSPDVTNTNERSSKPLLLVDSSGDSAIMVNPEATDSREGKRSDLIRLKPSTTSAGYADSSEVRQVLYFPTGTKQLPPNYSPWASLNFLYLYPSSMKIVDKDSCEDLSKYDCYSVRIRLVKQVKKHSETSYAPEAAFYNPSLIGDPLVTAVYTKIPLFATMKRQPPKTSYGIPFRDEIKMKLPMILDASYYLQFTLYSLRIRSEVDDHGGLEQNFISESLIPLASISSKEPILGTKVVTVIPNGVHRIKLSPFQLHVQSKLMSNTHVSDPCTAVVLRDFPSQASHVAHSEIVSYVKMLSAASIQSVYEHFYPLLFLFLRECMSSRKFRFSCKTMCSIDTNELLLTLEYIRGICGIFDKVKKLCNTQHGSAKFMKEKLLKEVIDNFDENVFLIDNETDDPLNDDDSSVDFSDSDEQGAIKPQYNRVKFEKGLSRRNLAHYSNASKRRRKYVDKFYASLDNTSPLNRKAYGVTAIDRLKAETELYESEHILTELVDDEETIVTATTWQSHLHRAPTAYSSELSHGEKTSMGSTTTKAPYRLRKTLTPLERAKDVALRLNSVARNIMAPCITPTFLNENVSPSQKQRYGGIIDKLSKDTRVNVLRHSVSVKNVSSLSLSMLSHCK